MQITPTILSNTLLQNIQNQESEIQTLQQEESTGQSFSVPENNPIAAETTLSLNTSLSAVSQYTTSANSAQAALNQTNGVLTNMISLFDQVIQTGTQAENSTNNQSDLNELAQSITSDQTNLGQMLNTEYEGSYLFGGYDNETPPVPTNSDGTYPTTLSSWNATASQNQTYTINAGTTITVNLTGYESVGQASGTNYLETAYNDLGALSSALQSGNSSSIQSAMSNIQQDYTNLTSAQGLIGGRLNRIQDSITQLQNASSDLSTSVASVSGANMAQVTTQLAQEEDSYQAALQSGSQILSLSLLNFINP